MPVELVLSSASETCILAQCGVPRGSMVVPFRGSCFEFYKVMPQWNYHELSILFWGFLMISTVEWAPNPYSNYLGPYWKD